MNIFKADISHAPIISELGATTFKETFVGMSYYTEAIIEGYNRHAFALDKIERELIDPKVDYLLMQVGEAFAGYAKLMDKEPVACITLSKPVYLERIYLRKRFMGQGLGTALLDDCYQRARERGFESLWLSVWEYNKPALSFYAKSGFCRVGEWDWPYESDGIKYVDIDWLFARNLPSVGGTQ